MTDYPIMDLIGAKLGGAPDEAIHDVALMCGFADLQADYPETYEFVESVLADWLRTQMPDTVEIKGMPSCLATVMGLIEINAAKIEARKVSETGYQFRVVLDDADLARKMFNRPTQ